MVIAAYLHRVHAGEDSTNRALNVNGHDCR